MKEINLRDYYPELYKTDVLLWVEDEVYQVLDRDIHKEAAEKRKMYRYKAQYSLDCGDNIETAALVHEVTQDQILETQQIKSELYSAVMELPEKQAKRIYARYYLGMTTAEIAEVERVDVSRVRDSIRQGKKKLKEKLKNF